MIGRSTIIIHYYPYAWCTLRIESILSLFPFCFYIWSRAFRTEISVSIPSVIKIFVSLMCVGFESYNIDDEWMHVGWEIIFNYEWTK